MNQEKIGKFIQELRKNKKMTQQELADRLSVTDKTVSHWENGRRMPDVSLFKPLCEIFNISVNELISGEKINKNNLIEKSEENILNTISITKEKMKTSKKIIFILLIGIILTLLTTFLYHKSLYPKIDIYNIDVLYSNKTKKLKKQISNSYNTWYYGIDMAFLCDGKEKCYEINNAISHNQTNIEKIKNFLNSQVKLKNINKFSLYDGGTTIYSNNRYAVIICNTLDGNNDIYIGINNMQNELNGKYCGHKESTTKEFTRTYYIVSATADDDENYINVTLKAYQGETTIIKLERNTNITVGKTYEFRFINYYEFEDTIKNIFEYCQISKITETTKVGMEQINEPIYINGDK